MPSAQLRGHPGTDHTTVHTVGITDSGVLYVDVQKFAAEHSEYADTYYVRFADVARIKRLVALDRPALASDEELVRLLAASFHTADYVLNWLRWADVRVIRRRDDGACQNAEEAVPQAVFADALPQVQIPAFAARASR